MKSPFLCIVHSTSTNTYYSGCLEDICSVLSLYITLLYSVIHLEETLPTVQKSIHPAEAECELFTSVFRNDIYFTHNA